MRSSLLFLRVLLIVVVSGCFQLQAQKVKELYSIDFKQDGSVENREGWLFSAHDIDMSGKVVASQLWSWQDASGGNAQPYYNTVNPIELNSAVFSPVVTIRPEDDALYTVNVKFNTSKAITVNDVYTGYLSIRVHLCDGSGTPGFSYAEDGLFRYDYALDSIISEDGVFQSMLVGRLENGPGLGDMSYSFQFSGSQLGGDGNRYRISFIIPMAYDGSLKIESFSLLEKKGGDLSVGQLVSPVPSDASSSQTFEFYVKNNGQEEIDSFDVSYQFDNQEVKRQTVSGVGLKPMEVRKIVLPSKIGLPQGKKSSFRFWVELPDDVNRSNDTSCIYRLQTGTEPLVMPYSFDFQTDQVVYGWSSYSDSLQSRPAWFFEENKGRYDAYVSTGKENDAPNSDFLVTPAIGFEKGKVYRIRFLYQADLGSDTVVGEKSLACGVVENPSRTEVLAEGKVLWKCASFSDKGEREIILYYQPEKDFDGHLYFLNYGPVSTGGLKLLSLDLQESVLNTMDFSYSFDPYSGNDAAQQALSYLDFIDQDGNISQKAATPGGWSVVGNNSGYNSAYAARCLAIAGKANDWMVFKPVYLEKDTNYYLLFQTRIGKSNQAGKLEFHLQKEAPRYDLPYEEQPGLKWQETVNNVSYDTVRKELKVDASGEYFLSFRLVSDISGQVGEEEIASNKSVYIDNVLLTANERNSVQAVRAEVGYDAKLGRKAQLSMTVKNFSVMMVDASELAYCYQVDDQPVCREVPTQPMNSYATADYKFNKSASFTEEGDQVVRFWVEMKDSPDPIDTLEVLVEKLEALELPFEDPFSASSSSLWQTYPDVGSVWRLSSHSADAYSGSYSWICEGKNQNVDDYLVTPLLAVESGRTYLVSFKYKRGGAVRPGETFGLYYAYDRYDQMGFTDEITTTKEAFSTEYEEVKTYVRFPSSGKVFLGIMAQMDAASPSVHIDDFLMIDSAEATRPDVSLSGLSVPSLFSVCDTSHKRASLWVKSMGYTDIDSLDIYMSYDGGTAERQKIVKHLERGDSVGYSFDMPFFSAGEHSLKAWVALVGDTELSDDTVSARFEVLDPASTPYVEDFETEGKFYNISDNNGDGNTWKVVSSGDGSYSGDNCLQYESAGYLADESFKTDCFHIDTGDFYVKYFARKEKEDVPARIFVNLLSIEVGSPIKVLAFDTLDLTTSYQSYGKPWRLDEDGIYALEFRYVSSDLSQVVYLDSISVLDFVSPVDPEEPDTIPDDTGIGHVSLAEGFRIWPNPVSTELHLEWVPGADYLWLMDARGRVLLRKQVAVRKDHLSLDVEGLEPGIYFIRISGGNYDRTVKFIKR